MGIGSEYKKSVIVPLQIGVVFNYRTFVLCRLSVIVPLQIGVVFNYAFAGHMGRKVIVPLQIGVVFNDPRCFVL